MPDVPYEPIAGTGETLRSMRLNPARMRNRDARRAIGILQEREDELADKLRLRRCEACDAPILPKE